MTRPITPAGRARPAGRGTDSWIKHTTYFLATTGKRDFGTLGRGLDDVGHTEGICAAHEALGTPSSRRNAGIIGNSFANDLEFGHAGSTSLNKIAQAESRGLHLLVPASFAASLAASTCGTTFSTY
jgi:hypothetical protein